MSAVLFDTNVLSELVSPRPERRVLDYIAQQATPLISSLTLHELTFGAERAPDPSRRTRLIRWVAEIAAEFAGRIITIDAAVAAHAGRVRAAAAKQGITVAPVDALIAASAASRGAAIATRNVKDFAALGVVVIDPWSG